MTTYKIIATVIKSGNPPTEWTRFSGKKMTKDECEKFLSVSKEAGVAHEAKVVLKNFKCVRAGA